MCKFVIKLLFRKIWRAFLIVGTQRTLLGEIEERGKKKSNLFYFVMWQSMEVVMLKSRIVDIPNFILKSPVKVSVLKNSCLRSKEIFNNRTFYSIFYIFLYFFGFSTFCTFPHKIEIASSESISLYKK